MSNDKQGYSQTWGRGSRRQPDGMRGSDHDRHSGGADKYGLFGSKGVEVEAVDWSVVAYSGIMLLLTIANVALLAWIGMSLNTANTHLKQLDELTAFNDNLNAVKSSTSQVALALKDTNAHLLVNTVNNMDHSNPAAQTKLNAAYLDNYASPSKTLGSGSGLAYATKDSACKAMINDMGVPIYTPTDCEKKSIPPCSDGINDIRTPAPPTSVAALAPSGYDKSCVSISNSRCDGLSEDCYLQSMSQGLATNGIVGISDLLNELNSYTDATGSNHIASAASMIADGTSKLTTYFTLEQSLQTAYQQTYAACSCSSKDPKKEAGSSCGTFIGTFKTALEAFKDHYDQFSGYSATLTTQLNAAASAAMSATPSTLTQAAKDNIDHLLTLMVSKINAMTKWYEQIESRPRKSKHSAYHKITGSKDAKDWCKYLHYNGADSSPIISVAKCMYTPSANDAITAPVTQTDVGPAAVDQCPTP